MIPLVSTRSTTTTTTTTTTYGPESTTNHRGRRSVRRLFGGSPPTLFRPSALPPRPPLRLSSQASSSKRPCDWLGPIPVETKPISGLAIRLGVWLTSPGLSAIHPIPSRSTRPRARRPRGPSAAAALPNQNLNRGAADHLHLGPFHSQLFPHGSASRRVICQPDLPDSTSSPWRRRPKEHDVSHAWNANPPCCGRLHLVSTGGVADLFRIDPESLAGGLRGWWHRGSKPSSLPPRGNGDQGEKSHTG
ncbi:hypothetical protein CSOJ01_08750 [Colletotrichum sojae]|uniref:Uncharacterized protein n=1 Tax=Colletotrichum sojae TaxID=2175907 RepID=A0A8H6J5X9_9PEZI|nr:hypothetical protein CSOJ01_08750 [Colletotrichum sojae]